MYAASGRGVGKLYGPGECTSQRGFAARALRHPASRLNCSLWALSEGDGVCLPLSQDVYLAFPHLPTCRLRLECRGARATRLRLGASTPAHQAYLKGGQARAGFILWRLRCRATRSSTAAKLLSEGASPLRLVSGVIHRCGEGIFECVKQERSQCDRFTDAVFFTLCTDHKVLEILVALAMKRLSNNDFGLEEAIQRRG